MDKDEKTEISDTGSAIPKIVSEKIFKPFVLADESRMSKNGSGLGLASSFKIMEKHGGKLSLKENCKEYTKCFIVEF